MLWLGVITCKTQSAVESWGGGDCFLKVLGLDIGWMSLLSCLFLLGLITVSFIFHISQKFLNLFDSHLGGLEIISLISFSREGILDTQVWRCVDRALPWNFLSPLSLALTLFIFLVTYFYFIPSYFKILKLCSNIFRNDNIYTQN